MKTLNLIYELTKALNNIDNTSLLLDDVLAIITKKGFEYADIKIVDPSSEDIIIRHASGLSNAEIKRSRYKVGEGITGKVVDSGKAICIRDIDKDSRFLNKSGAYTPGASFFCHPILIDNKVTGTLNALSVCSSDDDFEEKDLLLKTITPMLSQSLKIHEKIERTNNQLKAENIELRSQLGSKRSLSNFIGKNSKMQHVFDQISMVANSNATVLIRGKNGTGKELVADTIHYSSIRSNKPFIKINCAALPESLLESELFGYEKGAFTGATQQKKGRFELADKGTLFLDEIGEINPSIQVKLLRFLQNREFERVGGVNTLHSNVRIIAATNKNLEKAIIDNTFREDLYYRLNVFPIYVPTLKERPTDITILSDFFLEKFNKENNKNITRISTPVIEMLTSYHWPGNVRELENCMERAVLVCQSDTIRASDLPPSLQTSENTEKLSDTWSLPQAIENLEKEMITEALKSTNYHQSKAATALGISERQIGYKIKKYNIDVKLINKD